MRIEAIRLFPLVEPAALPNKSDATTRRIEKHQEEYRDYMKAHKVHRAVIDAQFELYMKKAEQNRIRLEIFTNRKIDMYV